MEASQSWQVGFVFVGEQLECDQLDDRLDLDGFPDLTLASPRKGRDQMIATQPHAAREKSARGDTLRLVLADVAAARPRETTGLSLHRPLIAGEMLSLPKWLMDGERGLYPGLM